MIGTTLSHYEIESELGRGGMGIVYKARDSKLDRTVAIKVLPSAALASADDRERFYREAKSAAALNHPNIAQVYQIDEAVPSDAPHGTQPSPFIAMEYIEGGTLEDRIKQGPLKLHEAIQIGIQAAEALKAAHAKQIVHRDIKSANVMLAANGQAKVLDFGLAKTTQSTKLTRMGSTLGTVAYMSPEQARGDEVDARTDLYSLGTVLYEMIAGRLPFGGEYEQAVVYGIMNEEPEPLTALRTGVSMELERIVTKLLAKDAGRRYQSCADLIVDLDAVSLGASTTSRVMPAFSTIGPAPASSPHTIQRTLIWGIAAVAVLVGLFVGVLGTHLLEPAPALKPLQRVEIPVPGINEVRFPKISPDGKYLVFMGRSSARETGLYLKELDTNVMRSIETGEGSQIMEWGFSPDGSKIAFTQGSNGGVFIVGVPTGIPERKTETGRFTFWEDNETLVVTDDRPGGQGASHLNLKSGETTPIPLDGPPLPEGYNYIMKTRVPESQRVFGHELLRANNGAVQGDHRLFTADMSSGVVERIEPFAINPVFVPGGFLMYQIRDDGGKLVVRPVDPRTGQFTGQPMDVLEEGLFSSFGSYEVSSNGDLLLTTTDQRYVRGVSLWEVELSTEKIEKLDLNVPDGFNVEMPAYSPDGSSILFTAELNANSEIYELDREGSLQYQITFDGISIHPGYDPVDGSRIFARRGETRRVYRTEAGVPSGQEPELIWNGGNQTAFSKDGRWMAVQNRRASDVNSMALVDRTSMEVVWADSSGTALFLPSFSADSRYLAYNRVSEGGSAEQIVIAPVSGASPYVLPNTIAVEPTWSADGQYLYYNSDQGIERVKIRTEPVFNVLGEPELILPVTNAQGWDISSDGNRIVVAAANVDFDTSDSASETLSVQWYQNWSDHLKKVFSQ